MAAVLNDDTVYVNFPITKTEETPEGNIIVYGKATDGSVDSDEQIVDPAWSAKAIEEWLATGPNLRVQHNPHRDPAGIGMSVDVDRDGDGGHWVKSLVIEPVAKELVRNKALRAYSVGIMKPKIVSDTKARGGRIVDGELGEISLVDRPANRNCGIQLVKAAKDGPEYSGELFGDTDAALKASKVSPARVADVVNKRAKQEDEGHGGGGLFSDSVVERLSKALKDPESVEKRQMDQNVGGGVDRDKIPAADFAGRNRSFPIVTPGDVSDAAASIGRAGADNYSSDELKRRIIAIANRKGPQFVAQLPAAWREGSKMSDSEEEVAKGGMKDCPKCGKAYHADAKVRVCENCGTKLPAASEKSDEPVEAEKAADTDDDMKCNKCGAKMAKGDAFCAKCGTKSADIDAEKGEEEIEAEKGATPGDTAQGKTTEGVPAHREPDGPQVEIFERDANMEEGDERREGTAEPTPTWTSSKSVSYEESRLHDVLCAAYSPEVINSTYPSLKSVSEAVNAQAWQDEAMELIKSGDLVKGQNAVMIATAAQTIAKAQVAAILDARASLHKSFTDMYPGPGSAVTPTDMQPGKFRRPYISAGHASLSAEAPKPQPNPGSTGLPTNFHEADAQQFARGPLTTGHANPSPGKSADHTASYAAAQVGAVLTAMKDIHDHIAERHSHLCPLSLAPSVAPQTVGQGDQGVLQTVATKAAGSSVNVNLDTSALAELTKQFTTADAVEKMLNDKLTVQNDLLAKQTEVIATLQAQLSELAGTPDANQAPHRGITATKSNPSGGGIVERRSLIDEATARERAEKIAWTQALTKSGDPMMADRARTELERLLAANTGSSTETP